MNENPTSPTIPGLEPNHPWLAETLRVTAFAMPGVALAPKRWRDIFGAEPDQIVRQPSMPSIEGGPQNGARWLVTHQPDRVDIVVAPDTPISPPTDLLNIGELETVLDPLLSAAARAFDSTAAIQRVAVAERVNDFDTAGFGI
jgi:hypothetical protein